jgi:hypothetical protein
MRTNVIITDGFYNNPDEVRKFALSQTFDQKGNFPGSRTKSFINQSTKDTISDTLFPFAGKVTNWHDEQLGGYTGSFQITTSLDRSWIHSDYTTNWAGVLYLTPDAPLSSGTGLFKLKHTNSMFDDGTDLSGLAQDMTKWEMIDRIGNVYNRLVLYRSDIYHTSLDYFGSDMYNGRLFQLFFLTTEY